jgi:L-aminoadipate-semialdehyde dehydrogenase
VNCLIRAADGAAALQRLRELSTDRGAWDECWVTAGRVKIVLGDLNLASFGMRTEVWNGRVAAEVDVVVHNNAVVSAYICLWRTGAHFRQVYWVYPYEKLAPAKVFDTLAAMELAADRKSKSFVLVLLASAPDLVRLSDALAGRPADGRGAPDSDDLEGARHTFKTGYARRSGSRRRSYSRPAGEDSVGTSCARATSLASRRVRSRTRMTLSGAWSRVASTFGSCPTSTTQGRRFPLPTSPPRWAPRPWPRRTAPRMAVRHMTAAPAPTLNKLLSALARHWYTTAACEYVLWRRKLEQHVLDV